MRPAIPDTQGMPDILPPQDIRHLLITTARWIIPANGHDDIQVPQGLQACGIMLIGDERARIVEIHIIIREAPGKPRNIVEAAQSDHPVNQLRVTEREIHGMVGTKARSSRHQKGVGITLSAERYDFIQDVAVILEMPYRPLRWGPVFGIPALFINTIYAVQLNFALFQALTERGNHTCIFPLEETPH